MTLNINGIESSPRLRMLDDFLHRHDVDITLLQEVTNGDRLVVKAVNPSLMSAHWGGGTAILHTLHLQLHKLKRIPTVRGIAAYLGNICLVNIYAPSGTASRTDRQDFFNTDVVELIPQGTTQLILGTSTVFFQKKTVQIVVPAA